MSNSSHSLAHICSLTSELFANYLEQNRIISLEAAQTLKGAVYSSTLFELLHVW